MNPEVKEKWLAALRSGKYKQARERLRDGGGFCCLAVLCDIAIKEGVSGEWALGATGETVFRWPAVADRYLTHHTEESLLPPHVRDWAGLQSDNPRLKMDDYGHDTLSAMNDDHRLSFAEIADLIEKQL